MKYTRSKPPVKYIICLFAIVAIMSCESLVQDVSPDKLPKSENKLVINFYISPQDTLFVANVQQVRGAFDVVDVSRNNNQSTVIDAKIELSDGKTAVSLVYNDNLKLYTAKATLLKILAGNTYFLTATDNQNRTYTAQTTVPNTSTNFQVGKLFLKPASFGGTTLQIPLSWLASPNTYFRIGLKFLTVNKFQDQFGRATYLKNENLFFENALALNQSTQDQTINKEVSIYYSTNFGNNRTVESIKNSIVFLAVDKNYYNYHQKLELSYLQGDNPFAEPVVLFSNISNGYGCFGSYLKTEREYIIPKDL